MVHHDKCWTKFVNGLKIVCLSLICICSEYPDTYLIFLEQSGYPLSKNFMDKYSIGAAVVIFGAQKNGTRHHSGHKDTRQGFQYRF